jgi:hypothetical protein
MGFSDYKRDLAAPGAFNPFWILDRYFHCGQTHAFAEAHPDEEPLFKGQLARGLPGTTSRLYAIDSTAQKSADTHTDARMARRKSSATWY